jgi:hypothetical protein
MFSYHTESKSVHLHKSFPLNAGKLKVKNMSHKVSKVKQSLYTPWRSFGGEEI